MLPRQPYIRAADNHSRSPPGPPPPPPQTKVTIVGENEIYDKGKSDQAIFGIQTFGSQTSPFLFLLLACPSALIDFPKLSDRGRMWFRANADIPVPRPLKTRFDTVFAFKRASGA